MSDSSDNQPALSFTEFRDRHSETSVGKGWLYIAAVTLLAILSMFAYSVVTANIGGMLFSGMLAVLWGIGATFVRQIPEQRTREAYLDYLTGLSDRDRQRLSEADHNDDTPYLIREYDKLVQRNASFSTFKSVRSKPKGTGFDVGE